MMNWRICVGLGLSLAGWAIPRVMARAPVKAVRALALDLLPPFTFFIAYLALTARPLFAGVLTFAMMGGFAFTDWVKRDMLHEPVVFSDLGEAVELFRHPRLYLPFAGTGRVLAGAALAFSAFFALLALEPPVRPWPDWSAILIPALLILVGAALHGPLLGWTAGVLRTFRPSGDPFQDAAALGPLAMQLTYSLIARDERPARRLAANSRPMLARGGSVGGGSGAAAPVVVVQCESFFDPRRLHPGVPADFIPAFAEGCRTSAQWGRLTVPGWGANTMRAEFAVMTGLPEEAVGYDRFNPYFAFARAPLASLARRMRAEGYRTICLHPFDRTFYRRDHVMPYLGFDVFLGEEAFAGAKRSGHYVSDPEVARVALDIVREEGPAVFLFAITMDNHGPWETGPHDGPVSVAALPATAESASLAKFLSGVRRGDEMLSMITQSMSAAGAGLCAFYGDHLPSLPATFAACGFDEISTDYLIWRAARGAAERRDLAAHDLSEAIFAAAYGP
jgi:hypothetical protein